MVAVVLWGYTLEGFQTFPLTVFCVLMLLQMLFDFSWYFTLRWCKTFDTLADVSNDLDRLKIYKREFILFVKYGYLSTDTIKRINKNDLKNTNPETELFKLKQQCQISSAKFHGFSCFVNLIINIFLLILFYNFASFNNVSLLHNNKAASAMRYFVIYAQFFIATIFRIFLMSHVVLKAHFNRDILLLSKVYNALHREKVKCQSLIVPFVANIQYSRSPLNVKRRETKPMNQCSCVSSSSR